MSKVRRTNSSLSDSTHKDSQEEDDGGGGRGSVPIINTTSSFYISTPNKTFLEDKYSKILMNDIQDKDNWTFQITYSDYRKNLAMTTTPKKKYKKKNKKNKEDQEQEKIEITHEETQKENKDNKVINPITHSLVLKIDSRCQDVDIDYMYGLFYLNFALPTTMVIGEKELNYTSLGVNIYYKKKSVCSIYIKDLDFIEKTIENIIMTHKIPNKYYKDRDVYDQIQSMEVHTNKLNTSIILQKQKNTNFICNLFFISNFIDTIDTIKSQHI